MEITLPRLCFRTVVAATLLATACFDAHGQHAEAISSGAHYENIGDSRHIDDGYSIGDSYFETSSARRSSEFPATDAPASNGTAKFDGSFWELARPTISLSSEWQPESGDVELFSHSIGAKFPTYPFFGPPPPMIQLGFTYFDINANGFESLPAELYETSLGMSWMRKLNDRWMLRLWGGAANASDGANSTSDSWQFRGGILAINRRSPEFTWVFGALALGRNDVPVVPAIGLTWQPTPYRKVELILPKPRIAHLLSDDGARQQWVYIGGGFGGGTWGIESLGVDQQLTYREWKITTGWESIPTPVPGMPFTRGRKLSFELAYVFGRRFEFDDTDAEIGLSDAVMLRSALSF